jgi:hypothetical protein
MAGVLKRFSQRVAGGKGEGVVEPKVWVEEQRDNTVVLGYELASDAHSGACAVAVCANLPRLKRRLDEFMREGFDLQMKRTQQMASGKKITVEQMREQGNENMARMRRQQELQNEVFGEYKRLFALKECSDTVLAYVGKGDGKDASSSGDVWGPFRASAAPTLPAQGKGLIVLSGLPQDVEVELEVFRVTKTHDGKFEYASTKSLTLRTNRASWALSLEQCGLSSLVEPFQQHKLVTMDAIADAVEDKEFLGRLGVDNASLGKLSSMVAKMGHVTSAERKRLDQERDSLNKHVAENLGTLAKEGGVAASFYQGQLVKDKAGRVGVVAGKVAGGKAPPQQLTVRWDDAPGKTEQVAASQLIKAKFDLFLSHIQAEAQDSVGSLKMLCEEAGIQAWWDMEAEELTEMDMVRGILSSECFCVYLTASYLTSWFCRLEITTAMQAGSKLMVIWEADPRHGGAADYVQLVNTATRKYPEFRNYLLGTEALPMARRAFQRRALMEEVAKRLGKPAARANHRAQAQPGSSSTELGPTLEAELRDEISTLRQELASVWAAVDKLTDALKSSGRASV